MLTKASKIDLTSQRSQRTLEWTSLILAPFSIKSWASFKSSRYFRYVTNFHKESQNKNKATYVTSKAQRCDTVDFVLNVGTVLQQEVDNFEIVVLCVLLSRNKSQTFLFSREKKTKKKMKKKKGNDSVPQQSKEVFDFCYLRDRCWRLSHTEIRQSRNDHSDSTTLFLV